GASPAPRGPGPRRGQGRRDRAGGVDRGELREDGRADGGAHLAEPGGPEGRVQGATDGGAGPARPDRPRGPRAPPLRGAEQPRGRRPARDPGRRREQALRPGDRAAQGGPGAAAGLPGGGEMSDEARGSDQGTRTEVLGGGGRDPFDLLAEE